MKFGYTGNRWTESKGTLVLTGLRVIYRQNETADRGRPLKKIFIMAVNNARPGYFDSRNDFNTHDAERYCEDLSFQVGHRPEYG